MKIKLPIQGAEPMEVDLSTIPEFTAHINSVTTAAATAAATTEKNKLYGQISDYDKAIKALKEENETLKRAQTATPPAPAATPTPTAAPVATPKESGLDESTLRKMLDAEIAPLKDRIMKEYITRRCLEERGTLVEELVVGSTEQEVEASIVKAKAAFAKYVPATPPATPPPTPTAAPPANEPPPTPPSGSPPTVPPTPPAAPPPTNERVNFKDIKDADWAARREELKKSLPK